MKKKLLLIGGGGHCNSVADCVLALNEYDEVAIIDTAESSYPTVPVIGTDDDIPSLFKDGWTHAFITVGSVGDTKIRRRLFEMVKEIGLNVPAIVDPSAILGKNVSIGEGAFVGKRAVVNAGSVIGECAIINTGAIIEHDCTVGAFSHISPGAVLCGQVSVGHDSHLGANSCVRQLINIGDDSLVGMGSVVVRDLPSNVKAMGNPCKVVV
ncbi:MAG: acetyltransferase [Lachnospiraceae bacterium]|nr:acetyltransferase [Lachnospiraceae bacterium]